MSKHQKLLQKLFRKPTDFKWAELTTLLHFFGYERIEGDGSRVKFINRELDSYIGAHKPHPGNTLKAYTVKDIVEKLKEAGIKP